MNLPLLLIGVCLLLSVLVLLSMLHAASEPTTEQFENELRDWAEHGHSLIATTPPRKYAKAQN